MSERDVRPLNVEHWHMDKKAFSVTNAVNPTAHFVVDIMLLQNLQKSFKIFFVGVVVNIRPKNTFDAEHSISNKKLKNLVFEKFAFKAFVN